MNATPDAPPPTPAPAPARTFVPAAWGLCLINALIAIASVTEDGWLDWIGERLDSNLDLCRSVWSQPSIIVSTVPYGWFGDQTPFWKAAWRELLANTPIALTIGSALLTALGIACGARWGRVGQTRRLWWWGRFHAGVGFFTFGWLCYERISIKYEGGIDGGSLQTMGLLETVSGLPAAWWTALKNWNHPDPFAPDTLYLLLFAAEFILCTRVLGGMRSVEPDCSSAPV